MRVPGIVLVVIGAGIGGGMRYVIGAWVTGRWGDSFPWHTFAINVTGAFLLGALMVAFAGRGGASESIVLFLGVGVLGGFTTFSTLSYESVALMERGLFAQGAGYMFGSATVGIAACLAGMWLGRAM